MSIMLVKCRLDYVNPRPLLINRGEPKWLHMNHLASHAACSYKALSVSAYSVINSANTAEWNTKGGTYLYLYDDGLLKQCSFVHIFPEVVQPVFK